MDWLIDEARGREPSALTQSDGAGLRMPIGKARKATLRGSRMSAPSAGLRNRISVLITY
jgi:hypothetical protein